MSDTGRRVRGILQRHSPGMITCGEFEDFVLSYLEGELPLPQRKVFEFHMLICEECRVYLEGYRKAQQLGVRAFDHADETMPDSVPSDLVDAILDALEHQADSDS